jgi:hypothetical protein
MAKQQELVLNMSKLSGICGRLMCCLGYEVAAESDEETSQTPFIGDITVTEKAVSTEVAEERPEPEVPVPATQSKEPISSGVHQNATPPTTPPKTEGTEQKQGQGNRKRKKWRWRKFQKNSNPGNKPENK